jgi:cytochrome P450
VARGKEIPSLPRRGPLGFLAGNLGAFRRDRIALLERVARECGDIGAFHLGPRRVIVISSPELVRPILAEEADAYEKGPVMRRFARPILGDGLLAVDNLSHRRRRRLVAPAFHPRAVISHTAAIVNQAERAAERLAALPRGSELDLAEEMTRLTLAIIGRILFSVDLTEEAAELAGAFTTVLTYVTDQIHALVPLPLSVPTPRNRRVRRAIKRLRALLARMIEERRRAPADDVLSQLVHAREDGQQFTDEELLDEATNLFVAGHETIANALAWTWALSLSHTEPYAKLGDEDYALRALKEAMRLYPPVHSLGRAPSRPVEIGGYAIAPGEPILVSTYLIHRRADLFADPLRYDPDRFLTENEAALPRYSYLPFGAGPRVCIGAQLALMEGQIVLSRIARRVRFELLHPVSTPEMLVTLRPKHGVRTRVCGLE